MEKHVKSVQAIISLANKLWLSDGREIAERVVARIRNHGISGYSATLVAQIGRTEATIIGWLHSCHKSARDYSKNQEVVKMLSNQKGPYEILLEDGLIF